MPVMPDSISRRLIFLSCILTRVLVEPPRRYASIGVGHGVASGPRASAPASAQKDVNRHPTPKHTWDLGFAHLAGYGGAFVPLLDILPGETVSAGRSMAPASWRFPQWAVVRERR